MQKGNICWVPDVANAYVKGKIEDLEGDMYVCSVEGKENVKVKKDGCFQRAGDVNGGARLGQPDMDRLAPLNMAEVLENVNVLFNQPQVEIPGRGPAKIFSAVGPVLIVLNPFEKLPCYDEKWRDAYHEAGGNAVANSKLGPHCYRIAEEALQGLSTNSHQAIVICGESGAGKTYTNRDMLKYICEVAKGDGAGPDPEKITESCMVLESFGNSTTTRNDNSSRFGRFTELYMDDNGKVQGCGTIPYLLERSRINTPPLMERNYHVFFQMIRGKDAAKYNLKPDPKLYNFTKNGADVAEPGVYDKSDAADWDELLKKMTLAGFTDEMQQHIFEGIAASLHLGNVEVTGTSDSSSIAQSESLTTAANLLAMDAKTLADALTHKEMKMPGSDPIKKDLGKAQAESQRDTVAKMVYSRTFDFVVSTIDNKLKNGCSSAQKTVGLLDIFGFEDMATNGFEQMFINFTNERIQHLFNTIMFDREKDVYNSEGIDCEFLKGPNNLKCCELFLATRPAGIISLLAEQVSQNRDDSTDGASFVNLLNRNFKTNNFYNVVDFKEVNSVLKKKGLVGKGKSLDMDWKECFEIKHYAGNILYTVENFIPKSRDSLTPELTKELAGSKEAFISNLFMHDLEVDNGASTVGAQFRVNIDNLANTLDRGNALFVRCIKTNMQKVPNSVDKPKVLEQMVLGGVVAALEVRAAGLPDRLSYEEFCKEFGILQVGKMSANKREATETILRGYLGEFEAANDFKFGKTLVFMRSKCLPFLRGALSFKKQMYARRIQSKLWFNRILKINKTKAKFDELESFAKTRGLEKVKEIVKTLAAARANGQPVFEALAKAQAASDDMETISKALESQAPKIRTLLTDAKGLEEVIEKYNQRQLQVEGGLGEKVSDGQALALSMLNRLEAVERDAEECADAADPAEIKSCRDSIAEAKAHISKLQKEVFPKLMQEGSAAIKTSVDLEKEPWVVPDPCPEMTGLLNQAEILIKKSEELCYAVLKVRRDFQAAMKEFEASISENTDLLETLRGPARECSSEGLEDIADKVSGASKLLAKLQALQEQAKDPDAFKKTITAFIEATQAASEALKVALVELERRRAERAEREALKDKLDKITEEINHAREVMMKKKDRIIGDAQTFTKAGGDGEGQAAGPDFEKLFSNFQPRCAELRAQSGSDLSEWKPKVETLCEESKGAIAELEKFIDEQKVKSKSAFAARMSVFNH